MSSGKIRKVPHGLEIIIKIQRLQELAGISEPLDFLENAQRERVTTALLKLVRETASHLMDMDRPAMLWRYPMSFKAPLGSVNILITPLEESDGSDETAV